MQGYAATHADCDRAGYVETYPDGYADGNTHDDAHCDCNGYGCGYRVSRGFTFGDCDSVLLKATNITL